MQTVSELFCTYSARHFTENFNPNDPCLVVAATRIWKPSKRKLKLAKTTVTSLIWKKGLRDLLIFGINSLLRHRWIVNRCIAHLEKKSPPFFITFWENLIKSFFKQGIKSYNTQSNLARRLLPANNFTVDEFCPPKGNLCDTALSRRLPLHEVTLSYTKHRRGKLCLKFPQRRKKIIFCL